MVDHHVGPSDSFIPAQLVFIPTSSANSLLVIHTYTDYTVYTLNWTGNWKIYNLGCDDSKMQVSWSLE